MIFEVIDSEKNYSKINIDSEKLSINIKNSADLFDKSNIIKIGLEIWDQSQRDKVQSPIYGKIVGKSVSMYFHNNKLYKTFTNENL